MYGHVFIKNWPNAQISMFSLPGWIWLRKSPARTNQRWLATVNSLIWWSIISYLQRLKIFQVVFPFIIIVISAALRQEREAYEVCKTSDQFEDHSPWKDQSIHNVQKNLLFISIASHTSPRREMCWSTNRNNPPFPFIYCFECGSLVIPLLCCQHHL